MGLRYALTPYSNGMPFEVGGLVWTATQVPGDTTRAFMYHADDPGYATRAKTSPLQSWLVRDAGAPFPVAIDVWLADCGRDRGTVPSTSSCPRPFESIDIFVDDVDHRSILSPGLCAREDLSARFRGAARYSTKPGRQPA